MTRSNFIGLTKSKNGSWEVHYQHHHSTLRIGIHSKPGKYFSMKQNDNGSFTIKYYDKIMSVGDERYAYSEVLPEICPEFQGDEIEAEKFLYKNKNDTRLASMHSGIYGYCIEHGKQVFEYNTIEVNSELIHCVKFVDDDIENLLDIFCSLVKCTVDDLKTAINEYAETDSITYYGKYANENQTARERSIIHHF